MANLVNMRLMGWSTHYCYEIPERGLCQAKLVC